MTTSKNENLNQTNAVALASSNCVLWGNNTPLPDRFEIITSDYTSGCVVGARISSAFSGSTIFGREITVNGSSEKSNCIIGANISSSASNCTILGHDISGAGNGVYIGSNFTEQTGDSSIDILIGSNAKSEKSVLIGTNISAGLEQTSTSGIINSVLIGSDISATRISEALLIGNELSMYSSQPRDIMIGFSNTDRDTRVLNSPSISEGDMIILGSDLSVNTCEGTKYSTLRPIVIGNKNTLYTGHQARRYPLIIGHNSNSLSGIAIGENAGAGPDGIALGYSVNTVSGIAIGTQTVAGNSGVTIGNGSTSMDTSVALGFNSVSQGVAVGYNNKVTLGSGIAVGKNNNVQFNAMAFGNGITANSNQIKFGGNSDNYSLYVNGVVIGSDIRDKTDIASVDKSLDFITAIEPITYVTNKRGYYLNEVPVEETAKLRKDYDGIIDYDKEAYEKGTKKGSRQRVGVSAQQVEEAIKATYGTDNYADLVNDSLYDLKGDYPQEMESIKHVAYEKFVPFLIGAIKELNEKVKTLESKMK